MIILLLILHVLFAVALLGGITHQVTGLLRKGKDRAAPAPLESVRFHSRYLGVRAEGFTTAMILLFAFTVGLGALIYPNYRLNARIPFEELGLFWAVGLFEVKEHWAAVGLGCLPLYYSLWRSNGADRSIAISRMAMTVLLAFIIWFDFIVGHILNNIRGLQ